MPENPWDVIDAALLAAIRHLPADTDGLAGMTGYPADAVKSLVLGYRAAGWVTQLLPGCDQYQLTLPGRHHLARLTTAMSADTRKAA
jgi:hypothetical protein